MSALQRAFARLTSLFRRDALDREFDTEAQSHVELAVDDYVRRGMPEADARRLARVKFGGIEASKDAHRDARGLPSVTPSCTICDCAAWLAAGQRLQPDGRCDACARHRLNVTAFTYGRHAVSRPPAGQAERPAGLPGDAEAVDPGPLTVPCRTRI